jgi:hypothetical protein
MNNVFRYPALAFALSFLVQWLAARIGDSFRKKRQPLTEEERKDFGVVVAATLTLLGLIIGFSFSMAITRYDQRKVYEEAEANAIGTEYVRADLLPVGVGARVRELLERYIDLRVLSYTTRDTVQLEKIDADTARLRNELWSTVQGVAAVQPTPLVALTVSGMNDVLNAQGYTQAAWLNRIPVEAWVLMMAMAIYCNLLIGIDAHQTNRLLLFVLPLVLSISFFLIADIDSPRRGIIRVVPQNLLALSRSMHPH